MPDTRPIAFFDSGVGGLSVFKEVVKLLPNESTIFFADQINNPYGSKSKEKIKKITTKITKFLIQNDAKAIVVACNTASCLAIHHLRSEFNIPIIGVVPAIKPATNLTRNKKIAILSTPATTKSSYLKNMVKKFAKDFEVLRLACIGLEEAIEKNDNKKIQKLLDKYVKTIEEFEADVAVLGCTHYPLVKRDLEAKLKLNSTNIIDSGTAIAKRVKKILEEKNTRSEKKNFEKFYTTGDSQMFAKVGSHYLNYKIQTSHINL